MFGKNEKTIQELVKQFANQGKLKDKLQLERIRRVWKEMMGPTIYAYTYDLTFFNGKLTIILNNASLKNELHYGRELIIQNINKALNADIVKDILIK